MAVAIVMFALGMVVATAAGLVVLSLWKFWAEEEQVRAFRRERTKRGADVADEADSCRISRKAVELAIQTRGKDVQRLARRRDRLAWLGSSGTGTLVGRSLDVVTDELEAAQRDLDVLFAERTRLERAEEALYALADATRARHRRTRFRVPHARAVAAGEEVLYRVEAEAEVEAELPSRPGWGEATPA